MIQLPSNPKVGPTNLCGLSKEQANNHVGQFEMRCQASGFGGLGDDVKKEHIVVTLEKKAMVGFSQYGM